MSITAITVNGSAPGNIFPAVIMGAAAAATGDDVVMFFTTGGAPVLVKGEMEKIKANYSKGMPDLLELFESIRVLGGRILVCELALAAKDIKAEDFREGVEITRATSFLLAIEGARLSFSF